MGASSGEGGIRGEKKNDLYLTNCGFYIHMGVHINHDLIIWPLLSFRQPANTKENDHCNSV